jgi:hypothetical protein
MHITLVARRIILVVVFDERSSLGLVRLRVKRASQRFGELFEALFKRADSDLASEDSPGSPFAEITEDDIDNLFSD